MQSSDVILENKTDLVEAHVVNDTAVLAGRLNPRAMVFPTEHAQLEVPLPEHRGRRSSSGGTHVLPFETHCLRPEETVSTRAVERLVTGLSRGDFGHVARAKALLVTERGSLHVELASGRIETGPFTGELAESRLAIIGTGPRRDKLDRAL